jgi:hypothetical protein
MMHAIRDMSRFFNDRILPAMAAQPFATGGPARIAAAILASIRPCATLA